MDITASVIVPKDGISKAIDAAVAAGKIPAILEGPAKMLAQTVLLVEGADAVEIRLDLSVVPVKTG